MTEGKPIAEQVGPAVSIRVDNVRKKYRGNNAPVLDGISFEVKTGQTVGVVGPNGAGKTTLMLCLLALQRADSGSIRIFDKAPDDIDVRKLIGYMPERLNFEPWLSGREFLTYHWQLAGLPAETIRKSIEEHLSRCGLPQSAWDRRMGSYSRGMLQRVGIAQALLSNPKLLFLDEPTSGVDPHGALEMLETIRENKGGDRTIVINSHQLDHLERICDKVILVRAGKVAATEDLNLDASGAYGLLVRWLRNSDGEQSDNLVSLAASCGADLVQKMDYEARFNVDGDEGAARLISALVQSGLPVCMTRADSRLEGFFRHDNEEHKSDAAN